MSQWSSVSVDRANLCAPANGATALAVCASRGIDHTGFVLLVVAIVRGCGNVVLVVQSELFIERVAVLVLLGRND